jgi:hypothetical protein
MALAEGLAMESAKVADGATVDNGAKAKGTL